MSEETQDLPPSLPPRRTTAKYPYTGLHVGGVVDIKTNRPEKVRAAAYVFASRKKWGFRTRISPNGISVYRIS